MHPSTRHIGLVCVCVLSIGSGCGGSPGEAGPLIETHGVQAAAPAAPAPSATAVAPVVPQPGPQEPDRGLQDLRYEVALLRREVAEFRLQLGRGAATASAIAAAPDPRVDPQARAEAENARLLRTQALESSFRREDYDARWSQRSSAQVYAALAEADEALRSQVRSVECRSKSCRVELNADASGRLGQALPLILTRLTPALANVAAAQVDQGNGHQATVLFLVR